MFEQFNNGRSLENISKDIDGVDGKLKQYLSTCERGTATLKNFSNYQMTYKDAIVQTVPGLNTLKQGVSALGSTFKSLAINMTSMVVITMAIQAAVAIIDELIVTQQELEDKAKESTQAYEQTKNTLEDINSELETNKKKIEELQDKGSLTYVEKSELDKLMEVTRQLETQKKLTENQLKTDAMQAALDTSNVAKKYQSTSYVFGDGRSVSEDLSSARNQQYSNFDTETDFVSSHVAYYEQLNQELSKINEGTQEWSDKQAQIETEQKRFNDIMADLLSDIKTYEVVVDDIMDKDESKWSSNEQQIVRAYNYAKDYYDLMFMTSDPNGYNNYKFEDIFDKDGIELTKDEVIELFNAGKDLDLSQYPNLKAAIEEVSFACEEGKDNFSMFEQEANALADSLSNVSLDLDIADGMSDTVTVLEGMAEKLSTLADLQDALGKSFSLSREEALAFADVYPELLQLGEVTSKGLMQFNSDEVKNFIEGKQAEINADATSRETQLLNAKETLVAKVAECDAKLSLAESVANGELQLNTEQIELMAQGRQELINYLIDLGVTQVDAERAATAAMNGDMELYDKYTADVSSNVATNLATALSNAATNSKINANGMISNANAANKAYASLATQISAAAEGKVTGVSNVSAGATGVITGKFNTVTTTKGSTFADFKKAEASNFQLKDYIDEIELDRSNYLEAIDKIDAQIALIHTQSQSSLSSYSSGKYADKSSNKSSQKNAKEFSKVIDWISVAIDNLKSKVTQLGNTASSVYKTWSVRNNALSKQMTALVDLLEVQQVNYGAYMAQADSVGLSSYYKDLVQNGGIKIETITDENLAERIEDYQKWYDAAQECLTDIQDIEGQISDIMSDKFDNISNEFQAELDLIQKRSDNISKMVDINEKKGLMASARYYDYLKSVEQENIALMESERNQLKSVLDEAVQNKTIAQYSEKWYEMVNAIREVDSALLDANDSLLEFINSSRQVKWDTFDYLQDKVTNLSTEVDFLASLFENKKLYEQNGSFTSDGDALIGLRGINYNIYMQQANDYANSIKELDNEFKNDSLNTDYLERREELIKLQQELIESANGEIDAMKDLVSDGYETLLDYVQQLIDKRLELLQTERDYYNFQKEIEQRTNDVAQIEKTLKSYENDDSEEIKKTVQELKIQLQEAKDNLEEAEYDKYISDQEALFDMLSTQMEEWINIRLDNIDALLSDIITNINENSTTIGDTIKETAESVGYTLSDDFSNIFKNSLGVGSDVYNIISSYNNNFSSTMTGVQNTLNNIKIGVDAMVSKANAEAEAAKQAEIAKQQATQQTQSSSSNTNTSLNNNTSNSSSSSSGSKPNGATNSDLKSIFKYKKDNYNKSKLNRYTSIVDALKYFDFDSSFTLRGQYFKKLNGSGTYTGTPKQNTWLLSKFRNIMGYSNGGIVGGLKNVIKANGDDSLSINTLEKGETVLPKTMTPEWKELIGSLPSLNAIVDMEGSTEKSTLIESMNFSVVLPNVENYEKFKKTLLSDNMFDKWLLTSVNNALTNGSKTNKNRYK